MLSSESSLVALPFELQTAILIQLTIHDVFALRLVSRSIYQVITAHENDIARAVWPSLPTSSIPCECEQPPGSWQRAAAAAAAATSTSASVSSRQLSFSDLFQQHRRAAVERRLAATLTDLTYSKFLRIEIRPGVARLDAMREQLLQRICLALRHLDQYLLEYRAQLVEDIATRGAAKKKKKKKTTSAATSAAAAVTADHRERPSPPFLLLNAWCSPACLHELYCATLLLHTAVTMKLKPPSYASLVERVARRWTKDAADSGSVAKLYACGGLEGVDFVLSLRPYARRIEALRFFVSALERPSMMEAPVERKKAAAGEAQYALWWRTVFQMLPPEEEKRKERGIVLSTMPVLGLEIRRELFKVLPSADGVFLGPIFEALKEQVGSNGTDISVAEALAHLVRAREVSDSALQDHSVT